MNFVGALTDPLFIRIITAPIAGSILVGFIALCTLRWHRNETRRKALSEMLRSYVKAAQQLKRASDARLKCERIVHSFAPSRPRQQSQHSQQSQPTAKSQPQQPQPQPPQPQPPQPQPQHLEIAQATVNQLQERYSHHISEGLDAFTAFEAEYAANKFRFGRMTNVVLTEALQELSKLGEAVNAGNFRAVETRVGTVKELHGELNELARRLGTQSLRSIIFNILFGRRVQPDATPLLSNEQMDEVLALVHKRITTQAKATFKVYPPQYLIDNPNSVKSEVLAPELASAKFFLVFQDGETAALSLAQLVVFTHQLIFLAVEQEQLMKQLEVAQIHDVQVNLQAVLDPEAMMKPEVRHLILSKIDFAQQSSENMMPDSSRDALEAFDANVRYARRMLSTSPNHSLRYRAMSFGRWQVHLFSVEDRKRRNVKIKERRKKLKQAAREGKSSEPPSHANEQDYPTF